MGKIHKLKIIPIFYSACGEGGVPATREYKILCGGNLIFKNKVAYRDENVTCKKCLKILFNNGPPNY